MSAGGGTDFSLPSPDAAVERFLPITGMFVGEEVFFEKNREKTEKLILFYFTQWRELPQRTLATS